MHKAIDQIMGSRDAAGISVAGGTKIGTGFSLWLDAVRLACAVAVVEYHASNGHIAGFAVPRWPTGLDAVMIFFVLSGFVIAFVADTKEKSFSDYATTRLARLWSVLIPALLLTVIADRIGMALSPELYENWGFSIAPHAPLSSLIPSGLFLNQLWFNPIPPLSNGPVWSIGFEFWYYAIFAFLLYFDGWRRAAFAGVAAAIAGPRILLLAPVWLYGVGCYHIVQRWRAPTPRTGWMMFILPLVPLLMLLSIKLEIFVSATSSWMRTDQTLSDTWEYCDRFAWWYVAGLLVAVHFVGAHSISDQLENILRKYAAMIRAAAGVTLSLYLFHFPILLLITAIVRDWTPGYARFVTVTLLTILASSLLGLVFERQRYPLRGWLRSLIASKTANPSS